MTKPLGPHNSWQHLAFSTRMKGTSRGQGRLGLHNIWLCSGSAEYHIASVSHSELGLRMLLSQARLQQCQSEPHSPWSLLIYSKGVVPPRNTLCGESTNAAICMEIDLNFLFSSAVIHLEKTSVSWHRLTGERLMVGRNSWICCSVPIELHWTG